MALLGAAVWYLVLRQVGVLESPKPWEDAQLLNSYTWSARRCAACMLRAMVEGAWEGMLHPTCCGGCQLAPAPPWAWQWFT